RARQAVDASGGRLGVPKIVDPSGGVCQTPVLAGWPSYVGGSLPTDVERPENIVVTGSRMMSAPPPPPPPAPAAPPSLDQEAAAIQVTLQPPLQTLTDTACVVYSLLP